MAGYFGTDIQQRLQAQAEESAEFIAHTPGACQAGRTMGCDDPKQFGWDRIGEIVERDGVCGFRLVDTADVPEISSELFHAAAGSTPGRYFLPNAMRRCSRPARSRASRYRAVFPCGRSRTIRRTSKSRTRRP